MLLSKKEDGFVKYIDIQFVKIVMYIKKYSTKILINI